MGKKEATNQKSSIAEREEKTLAFWRERKIFEKSVENPPAGGAKNGEFVFYDGPPFATGLPHYGHILPGTIKDIIPRYKTMRGYRVPRRWGWDCHGLPIENLVEKELGLETKKDIEKFGIEKFNERARASVLTYEKEWREIIPRTGRWIDMDNAYKTMDVSYTESVWWSFKNLFEKKLIYRGFKSMHLCPRCETTLSNFEVNQGYKDITDISVYVKFELVDEPNTFLLAWTTTPWTLPGNAALAINPNIKYQRIKKDGAEYILAQNLVEKVLKTDYEILEESVGEKLVGRSYKTLFDYYQKMGKVYAADFVSTEEGTGIVHIAPAFGEEDYQLSLREKIPLIQHVGTDGRFKAEVADFAGELVKPKDDHQATDIKIIKYLAGKNLLFAKEKIVHSYPHCWRCDTPLLNYASSSWFLKVTDEKLKEKIIAENKKVQWVPEEIRDGRFGKWLEGARDWAISRSRYWGSTLPVWECAECKAQEVFGSVEELKKKLPQSGNKYYLMRHGEAESNVKGIITSDLNGNSMTEKGREQVLEKLPFIKDAKISLIFSSDLVRTRETTEIIASELGYAQEKVIYDNRLRELNFGDYSGEDIKAYHRHFGSEDARFSARPPNGENLTDLRKRVMNLLYELESKYQDQNILLVSHGDPTWLMQIGAGGATPDNADTSRAVFYLQNGEIKELNFVALPHNADYELDLHRPYIDEVKFKCGKCVGEMSRVPEVFDTWYDSGSVAFASNNLRELVPADFIAEGLDQTRGWFYTMLVLGTALFGQSPYKQVVVNGLVLAEDGKKMSKRLKNYPELTDVLDKYGADALRYYLIASPLVRAEDAAFSEKGLDEVVKKIILRLENVLAFYELYQKENDNTENNREAKLENSKNILDQWILSRLAELNREVTENLEKYELDKAARPLALFVDDLSTWYLRRSRKRLEALTVLRHVLLEFSKILAPFMPFLAEEIYKKLKSEKNKESVHLEVWPEWGKVDEKLLNEMSEARRIVSLGLELRAQAGIKVRQPLAKLIIKNQISGEYQEIIRDELNLKEIVSRSDLPTELELDTTLTAELREEGELRDLMRVIQDARKEAGLLPGELAVLTANPAKQKLIEKNEVELKQTCALAEITFDERCPTISITRRA